MRVFSIVNFSKRSNSSNFFKYQLSIILKIQQSNIHSNQKIMIYNNKKLTLSKIHGGSIDFRIFNENCLYVFIYINYLRLNSSVSTK